MKKLFKLQNITKHKLIVLQQLNKSLQEATEKGWTTTALAIQAEITKTKHEAMNPQEVIDSIMATV